MESGSSMSGSDEEIFPQKQLQSKAWKPFKSFQTKAETDSFFKQEHFWKIKRKKPFRRARRRFIIVIKQDEDRINVQLNWRLSSRIIRSKSIYK